MRPAVEEELWRPGWGEPVLLPDGSSSLYLVKRIRDEAHRFAIGYHRKLRAASVDEIAAVPGMTRGVAEAVVEALQVE